MDTPAAGQSSPLAPFRNGTFLEIWLASLVSNFGGLIQIVGAGWMMTSISSSADMVALVQASTSLPVMLFSLAAGAIADNFNRRRVMLTAQIFMLLVSIGLAVSASLGLLTPWTLLGFTFLIGCGTALNNPSWQASVGDIVPRADLPAAVVLNSVGFNLTRSVGPAIGGIIVAAAGAAAAFAVNALSYLMLIFVLVRWHPSETARALPREDLGAAMGAGLRYVAMSPNLGKVILRSFLFGLSAIAVMALLPLVARDLVAGGPLTYGILLGAFGVGAVGGATLSGPLRARLSTEWIVRLAFLAFAVSALIAGVSRNAWITGGGLMIGGAAWVLALSLFNVTVQLSTPRWVLGRALALYQTAAFGGMAVGSWIWGALAVDHGAAMALIVAAASMVGGAIIGIAVPLPRRTDLDLDPLNRWKMPDVSLDLRPRSGPIAIMIEYVIPPENEAEFLDVMTDRKRMRRRDGARHWTLMRDISDPTLWMESYQTPTWVEYQRHNLRATNADAAIGDRLRALHRGGPFRVHRMIVRQTSWIHTDDAHTEARLDMH